MAYKIDFAPLAEADLDSIVQYISSDNPEVAYRFGSELIQRTRSLAEMPYLGSLLKNRKDVRHLIHTPYQILYRVSEQSQTIQILRFWHGARNPRSLKLK